MRSEGLEVVDREGPRSFRYSPPPVQHRVGIWRALEGIRSVPPAQYDRFLTFGSKEHDGDEGGPPVYFAGDIALIHRQCVAVVGARKVSQAGIALADEIAQGLTARGIVVVSGLAKGVDSTAHRAAIASGGQTIAVIGTPLDKAYPVENAPLQESIYRGHLLLSPFARGATVTKLNFPQRNKFMAAISDATVIIEASDTSGTLHQATECGPTRLDRWLFISESVVNDDRLKWPAKFLGHPKTRVFRTVDDIVSALPA